MELWGDSMWVRGAGEEGAQNSRAEGMCKVGLSAPGMFNEKLFLSILVGNGAKPMQKNF